MVTISCSCGSASTTRRNPLRGLSLEDRVELVRDAYSVHAGFATLEVDASWHPAQDDASEACVVLLDLDALDATEGLDDADARCLRNLLEVAHVRGRLLPPLVAVDGVQFRIAPDDVFTGDVTYLVHDGSTTLLEHTGPLERALLDELVGLHRAFGPAALVQVDGLAPRLGLRAAVDGVLRARTPSVA
ncbi:hypothetical protein [Cellulomonas rhizosphaerae]|uniref:Uncharacterized protein n=1 Tax=Cellulomonas rhizosphaerae TaxID=2293719 RepID=A0A413RH82_9CELL|nr:hypothetical protein [Cellulomonas rhizosphaerae]RHA37136.1 hypothetical protein D1825_17805 [Cellulomonas rhizosphaerae]